MIKSLLVSVLLAQVSSDVEMADAFRAEGKIYVVVAIVMMVLLGLIVYLFAMDRKLKKLEKIVTEKEQTKSTSGSF